MFGIRGASRLSDPEVTGVLPALSQAPDRSRVPPVRRHRRRRVRDSSRVEARAARRRTLELLGYGADVASLLRAALEGRERNQPPAPLLHVSIPAAGGARSAGRANPPRGVLHARGVLHEGGRENAVKRPPTS